MPTRDWLRLDATALAHIHAATPASGPTPDDTPQARELLALFKAGRFSRIVCLKGLTHLCLTPAEFAVVMDTWKMVVARQPDYLPAQAACVVFPRHITPIIEAARRGHFRLTVTASVSAYLDHDWLIGGKPIPPQEMA